MFDLFCTPPKREPEKIFQEMLHLFESIMNSNTSSKSKKIEKAKRRLFVLAFNKSDSDETDNHLIEDAEGKTILHYAAMWGYAELFDSSYYTFGMGAVKTFDCADKRGFTPAIYAALNGQTVVLNKLIILQALSHNYLSGCETARLFSDILHYRYMWVYSHLTNDQRKADPFKYVCDHASLVKEIDRLQRTYDVPESTTPPTEETIQSLRTFAIICREEILRDCMAHIRKPSYGDSPNDYPKLPVLETIFARASRECDSLSSANSSPSSIPRGMGNTAC